MLYVLIVLVIIGYILNELSKKYSLYKLTYKRSLSKLTVEIGEEFEIATIIENKKVMPVSFLQVIEKIPIELSYRFPSDLQCYREYSYHKTTMFIMPKQRIKRTYKVAFEKRGRYVFSDVSLIAGDFLGTRTVSTEQAYEQEMVVYPNKAHLEDEIRPYGSYYGDISVRRWIISDPILTIGIREYTGAEPQKSIHWPSSLKAGRLMVRNYDYTTDNKVMIILNIECAKPFWSEIESDKIERCISITRGIMEELEGLGISYGFTTNIQCGDYVYGKGVVHYGYGAPHFYNILEVLGRADYSIGIEYEELLEKVLNNYEKSITYILITPNLLKEYIEDINMLGKNAEKTILVSIGEENLDALNEKITIFVGKDI